MKGGEPYGYTGEWYEGYLELLHLRARWYAAETGTFLSRDPFELEQNLYQYAASNPVNFADPSGNCIPEYNCPGDVYKQVEILIKMNVELEATEQTCSILPLPPLTWEHRENLSQRLSAFALVTDYAQLGVSGIGVIVEVVAIPTVGTVADVAEPVIPPPIEAIGTGIAVYKGSGLDQIEAGLSFWGFLATTGSDIFAGNSYIDANDGIEFIIGQDTVVSAVSFLLSASVPEAFTDASVNVGTIYYDHNRLTGNIPRVFQVRFDVDAQEFIQIELLNSANTSSSEDSDRKSLQ